MATGDFGAGEKSARKLGGTLSVLAGVVFFATALAFFLLPRAQHARHWNYMQQIHDK
jgi:hypothetical protein